MSKQTTLTDRFNIFQNFVLNNDATSLEAALDDSDQTDVVNYVGAQQTSLLFLAAKNNFVGIAKLLLRAKADVNQLSTSRQTPLIAAVQHANIEMVRLLLKQPETAIHFRDRPRFSALHYALANANHSMVQLLLKANADIDDGMRFAATCGCGRMLRFLLRRNADVHRLGLHGRGLLHIAAAAGRDAAVSVLLTANACVDLGCQNGGTPLFEAARANHISTVRLLLAAGANVNHGTCDRETPLYCAALGGHTAMVDELLTACAEPDAVVHNGLTAMMAASNYRQGASIIASLLRAKADLNATDKTGASSLIWAVQHNNAPAAKLLLDSGADLTAKSRDGCNARQTARRHGMTQVRMLFECLLCGWEGMCCGACRAKYCVMECDKFTDPTNNKSLSATVDCRLHRKIAHQSVLDWTLAMSGLNLPPYVVEIIFNAFKLNSQHENYQQRKGIDFVWISKKSSQKINANFIHLIIEERTHQQNIKLFIAVQQACRKSKENRTSNQTTLRRSTRTKSKQRRK